MASPCCSFAREERARPEGSKDIIGIDVPYSDPLQGIEVSPKPSINISLDAIKGQAAAATDRETVSVKRRPWLTRLCSKRCPGKYVGPPSWMPKELLLVIYMFSALLTTCVYFGFPALRRMLITAGAYSWLCTDTAITADAAAAAARAAGNGEYPSADDEGLPDEGAALCNAQDAAVGPLFTMAMVSHSLMSAVAGALLDHVGPKLTALMGQTLNVIGWLLLATSCERFPAYIPGLVCIGLGADACYLPLLKIVNLFKNRSGAVISLLGVACTASFGVPVVLEMIWLRQTDWGFAHICGVYVLMGPGLSILIAIFLIPWKAFAIPEEETEKRQSVSNGDISLATTKPPCSSASTSGSSLPVSVNNTSLNEGDVVSLLPEGAPPTSDSPSATPTRLLVAAADAAADPDPDPDAATGDVTTAADAPPDTDAAATADAATAATTAAGGQCCTEMVGLHKTTGPKSSSKGSSSSRISNSRVFLSEVFSVRFLCIPVFASSQQLAISFFQVAAPRLLERHVADQMDRFLSLAFIPCILIGTATDYFGIFRVLFFVNTLGLFAYAFTLGAPAYAPHLVSLVCFCGYVALDSELVFCCVNKMFSNRNFGKLSGIAQATGGLVSLLSIPLYNSVSVGKYRGNCKPVVWGLAITLACIYPLLGLVWWLQSKAVAREASSAIATDTPHGPQEGGPHGGPEEAGESKTLTELADVCADTTTDEKDEMEMQAKERSRIPVDAAV